jgi:hypothetical protein
VYLRSDEYEPAAEYVDGAIEERAAGNWDHSSRQSALLTCFCNHADQWQLRVRPSLLTHVAPTRYRVPDVALLDRAQPIEQILTRAPLAVFEIISPKTRCSVLCASSAITRQWEFEISGSSILKHETVTESSMGDGCR